MPQFSVNFKRETISRAPFEVGDAGSIEPDGDLLHLRINGRVIGLDPDGRLPSKRYDVYVSWVRGNKVTFQYMEPGPNGSGTQY